MAGRPWSESEIHWFFAHPDGAHEDFVRAGFQRTYHAWRMKKLDLDLGRDAKAPTITDNSREPDLPTFREWKVPMTQLQKLRKRARGSLEEEATIDLRTEEPIAFLILGDTHLGAWSTDYDLCERITDEILATPNLYVALLGDMAHMAIKLRGVVEVGDNLLPASEQLLLLSAWLLEIKERVLFATWGNHEVERVELQAGLNPFGDLYRKNARHYFNGIGHLTVRVNAQEYRLAANHTFKRFGRSEWNPCHGHIKYLAKEGMDRDMAIGGDSHLPGIHYFTLGPEARLAVNCGSTQTASGYAQRGFSLYTHPIFPVVVLHHQRKDAWAHWNVAQYLEGRR